MAVIAGHGEQVPAIYPALILQLCERFGASAEQVLEGTGLTRSELEVSAKRVPQDTVGQIIVSALRLTREPGLGFYLGYMLKLSSHGSVGMAAMTAATLRETLIITERYAALRVPSLIIKHHVDDERENAFLELELVHDLPLHDPVTEILRRFLIEAVFTCLWQMGSLLLGRPLRGMAEVTFAEPPYFQGFAHLFAGPVRFGQPKNRLIFGKHVLDEQLRMADAISSKQALEQCEAELKALGATSSLLASVRRDMLSQGEGFPSLTELARSRRVSARTLKRQLAAHGTSFQRILDELRRDRALTMLEDPAITAEQIATALGYSDASNFTRAFRRWLGAPPSAFRARKPG